jgi:hypothetical protein
MAGALTLIQLRWSAQTQTGENQPKCRNGRAGFALFVFDPLQPSHLLCSRRLPHGTGDIKQLVKRCFEQAYSEGFYSVFGDTAVLQNRRCECPSALLWSNAYEAGQEGPLVPFGTPLADWRSAATVILVGFPISQSQRSFHAKRIAKTFYQGCPDRAEPAGNGLVGHLAK